MTSSLPPGGARGLRALHHHRVHDRRRAPAADHLAGDALLQPGAATIDVTTGLGYPKKADDAERNPRVVAALLRPDRLGDRRGRRGPRPGHGRGRRPRPRREPRALLCASRSRSCRRRRRCTRRSRCAGCSAGTTRASTSRSGPSASSSGPTATSRREPSCSTPTWRRCARATARSRRPSHAPSRGRRRRAGTSASSELGERYDTAVLTWVGPDGFPLSVRVPVEPDESARSDRDRRRAGGPAARRGPRLPHRAPPRARLHLAAELPGPRRPRRARAAAGRSSRASWSAASSCPTRACSRRTRRNFSKDAALLGRARESGRKQRCGASRPRPARRETAPGPRARGPAG